MSTARAFPGNPYYDPEACGLKQLGMMDDADSYEFHILVLWQDVKSGKLYYAVDSGCSCPTPFEDYQSLADLTPLNQRSWKAFETDVDGYRLDRGEKDALLKVAKGKVFPRKPRSTR